MSFSFLSCLVALRLSFFFFFFNDTATTEIYTLSLHDALPIFTGEADPARMAEALRKAGAKNVLLKLGERGCLYSGRSEEHTSELQSRLHLVCRLLLEKKKKKTPSYNNETRLNTEQSRARLARR